MSFDALAWAAKQRTGSSGTKLVLMGLAECASRRDALAFPCIAELVEFSSLNRKSIIANLDALERGGFIADTGDRVGRTKQVKVYRLNLELPATMRVEAHYVYRLSDCETGEFYIGVRSFLGEPTDDGYMGSGKWPTGAAFHGNRLTKEVLASFGSRTEAEADEAARIEVAMREPLCKNVAKEFLKRDRKGTDPKSGQFGNSSVISANSPKNGTRNKSEPVSSEAKASSPRARFAAPPGVSDEQWDAFRKQRKKAINARSYVLLTNKLNELAEDGWPPGDMIDLAIERGWETVFAPRTFGNERNNKPSPIDQLVAASLGFGAGQNS